MNFSVSVNRKKRAIRAICRIVVLFTDHPAHPYSDAQISFILAFISDMREFLLTACRGGGKTELAVIATIIVCVGEAGTRGLWLSGDSAQMSEARSKLESFAIPFAGVWELTTDQDTHQMKITFFNASFCNFNPTTKTSGMRVNWLVFDEEGKIDNVRIVKKNKDAYNTTKGTFKWPIRIRHITTLAIGTPAATVYKSLRSKGLVLKYPATDPRDKYQHEKHKFICMWVQVTDADLRWGEGHVNCELLCILDNPEGKRVLVYVDVFDRAPEHIYRLTPGWYCRVTIDWNATKKHHIVVTITNGEDYYIIDECVTDDLHVMAVFIAKYRGIYRDSCLVIQEWQGGMTQSREQDLIKYEGCTIDVRDPWDAATQQIKIPLARGITERHALHCFKGCRVFLDQFETFCLDENGKIPDDLDDHAVVSWMHSISTVCEFKASMPAGTYEEI